MSQPNHPAFESIANHLQEEVNSQGFRPYPEILDSSEPLFTMYCKMTEKDNKKAEFMQKYAEVIIIFMGLFSAAVAAILTVTIQDLKPDTQETSAFYLESLYQLQFLGDSIGSRPSTPARPPLFSPPNYAIWANSLLFMSLVFNLGTAILTISLRRWMTKSLLFTRSLNNSPHDRARVQDVLVNEYEDFLNELPAIIVRIMIHLSAFLLWAGASIYLFHFSKPVFIVFFFSGFICLYLYLSILYWLRRFRPKEIPSAADVRVLDRLFKTVVEDSDLVQFLENIISFCQSNIVDKPLQKIKELRSERFQTAVQKLLEHTWSSNFLSASEKLRRLVVCVNFADTIRLPNITSSILESVFTQGQHDALRSVEMGHLLRHTTGLSIGSCAQTIVAGIISKVQPDDSSWIALAMDQIGPSLPRYLGHGNDSVLLANLIHITRQLLESFNSRDGPRQDMANTMSLHILPTLSHFDIRNTLPELKRDFLALWNGMEKTQYDTVVAQVRDRLRNFHDVLTLPLVSQAEDRHDSARHAGVDSNHSVTLIRSSPNLIPVSISPSSRTLSQRASGRIAPEACRRAASW